MTEERKGEPSWRSSEKLFFLSLPIFLGLLLIIIGAATRPQFGEVFSITITQVGGILIALAMSQLFFVAVSLPDIVRRTISTTYELSDPERLIQHLSDVRSDQKAALKSLVGRMFGIQSSPPEELTEHIRDFVDKHTKLGFYRENYRNYLTLKPIETEHPLSTNRTVTERYFEIMCRAEYEVINVKRQKAPYRIKLSIDNHDYEGIPHDESISLEVFKSEKIRTEDGTVVETCDLKSEIFRRYVEKLNPLVSNYATVFINLNRDTDPVKLQLLDEILTKSISPDERLKVTVHWKMYVRKQDFHESVASYFTKGFYVQVTVPENVAVSFEEHFDAIRESSPATTSNGETTHFWGTHDFIHPNEGGVVYWRLGSP